MTKEVRYQLLRPANVVQRREACPVVYIPIGTLEWHGLHNPLGADSLQAEYLAIRCAQIGGGLVFPPLYYGESRTESLMESTAADHEEIARLMHLDPKNFSPEKFIYTEAEQSENYLRLLAHILNEADTLGFEVGVLIAGHYPLVDYASAAALIHNKRRRRTGNMLAWATSDFLQVREKYENAGDHAGGWETSHCMAIDPALVDLSALKPRGENLTGVMWTMDPHDANAE
ncbi:MAG: creatininase family protein, partial [Treponema sp.]|nr:creatininase family protein [Treponema sp.]